jgi:hypothetical protein
VAHAFLTSDVPLGKNEAESRSFSPFAETRQHLDVKLQYLIRSQFFHKTSSYEAVQDAGYEGLVRNAIFNRPCLKFVKSPGWNPNVYSFVLLEGLTGILPMFLDFLFKVFDRLPFITFITIKNIPFSLI